MIISLMLRHSAINFGFKPLIYHSLVQTCAKLGPHYVNSHHTLKLHKIESCFLTFFLRAEPEQAVAWRREEQQSGWLLLFALMKLG